MLDPHCAPTDHRPLKRIQRLHQALRQSLNVFPRDLTLCSFSFSSSMVWKARTCASLRDLCLCWCCSSSSSSSCVSRWRSCVNCACSCCRDVCDWQSCSSRFCLSREIYTRKTHDETKHKVDFTGYQSKGNGPVKWILGNNPVQLKCSTIKAYFKASSLLDVYMVCTCRRKAAWSWVSPSTFRVLGNELKLPGLTKDTMCWAVSPVQKSNLALSLVCLFSEGTLKMA